MPDEQVPQPTSVAELLEQQRRWESGLPAGVESFYSHAGPNQPIGLYRGSLPLRRRDRGTKADVLISLRWNPSPQIVW